MDFQKKNTQTLNFMKILPVGSELFPVDGQTYRRKDRQTNRETERQTDRTKLIVAFRNLAKAP
jgi:hypothetical protein